MAWDWQIFCKETTSGDVIASCFGSGGDITYLDWLLSAWGWTLSVAVLALVVALLVGSLMGILRTTPNKRLVFIGNAWTELFRNIPLLVQIFLWYHVMPSLFNVAAGRAELRAGGVRARLLHLGAHLRAGQGRHPEPAERPALRRPGDGPDAAADLPLRAAADGVSHRHPAAHQRER